MRLIFILGISLLMSAAWAKDFNTALKSRLSPTIQITGVDARLQMVGTDKDNDKIKYIEVAARIHLLDFITNTDLANRNFHLAFGNTPVVKDWTQSFKVKSKEFGVLEVMIPLAINLEAEEFANGQMLKLETYIILKCEDEIFKDVLASQKVSLEIDPSLLK